MPHMFPTMPCDMLSGWGRTLLCSGALAFVFPSQSVHADAPPPPHPAKVCSPKRQVCVIADKPGYPIGRVTSLSDPPAFAPWRACGPMNSLSVTDHGGVVSMSQEVGAPLWQVDVPIVSVCNPQGIVQSWTLQQLVQDVSRIPRSTSMFLWVKDAGMEQDLFWIRTVEDTRLTFDLRDGRLTRSQP